MEIYGTKLFKDMKVMCQIINVENSDASWKKILDIEENYYN